MPIMISSVTFAGSKSNTPPKASSITGDPTTEVPNFDEESFQKFLTGLDSSINARNDWLTKGDQFIAGSSATDASAPSKVHSVEVPGQFKQVIDPYHAFQASQDGKFSPSVSMERNLEALIGETGRDIDEVAAEQPLAHVDSEEHRPNIPAHQVVQSESEQASRAKWKDGPIGKILRKFCIHV
jgi:hypothetical protein